MRSLSDRSHKTKIRRRNQFLSPARVKRSQPWIQFENVTLRVRDRRLFSGLSWSIRPDQNWLILGANGSGKTTLMQALTGKTAVVRGTLYRVNARILPRAIGYVSFERHQRIIAHEQDRDAARYFSGQLNTDLTAAALMVRRDSDNPRAASDPTAAIIGLLGIEHLLHRPLRALSTGEIRKVLIAQALLRSQGLVLLDEPFEGLDATSRVHLEGIIERMIQAGFRIMLATHRMAHALPVFTHVIGLKDCKVLFQGPCATMLTEANLSRLYAGPDPIQGPGAPATMPSPVKPTPHPLIDIRDAGVQYGGHIVFQHLTWKFMPDQHWAVVGPNGSGKSTLLRLVSADHPQAYANHIYLFGRRRGSGESIWDIKQRVGLISSEFQIDYRKPLRALDVMLSGFFDSIGLYRRATGDQRTVARQWSHRLHLTHLEQRRFDRLSYGEQRMVLLARALVKSPELLILDEPCQGLDPSNRRRILALVDHIGTHTSTRLLFVTHQSAELPACITHVLDLKDQSTHRRFP